MSDRLALLLFVRSPEKGKVKTRLADAVGEKAALEIYTCFLRDIIETLEEGLYPFRIFFSPAGSRDAVEGLFGNAHLCVPQRGEDLGAKMEDAFVQSFDEGLEKVLVIGSDIPDITEEILDEAFSSLNRNDAVIGPARDGGYYLIGFRKDAFLPMVFEGISWGAGSVFRETMEIFGRAGKNVHILPEGSDIDTIEDLWSFFVRHRESDFSRSGTISYLQRNRENIFKMTCRFTRPEGPFLQNGH